MSKLRTIFLASVLGIAATTTASAAWQAPQIPNPANPNPEFPVATDGSPLPPMGWANGTVVQNWAPHPEAF